MLDELKNTIALSLIVVTLVLSGSVLVGDIGISVSAAPNQFQFLKTHASQIKIPQAHLSHMKVYTFNVEHDANDANDNLKLAHQKCNNKPCSHCLGCSMSCAIVLTTLIPKNDRVELPSNQVLRSQSNYLSIHSMPLKPPPKKTTMKVWFYS